METSIWGRLKQLEVNEAIEMLVGHKNPAAATMSGHDADM